jgi:thiamine-monophosphate kinase
LGFAPEIKSDADWLAERLKSAGHKVTLENAANRRASHDEIERGISDADLVVSLVTPSYAIGLDGKRVLEFAQSAGKTIIAIFAGLQSTDKDAGAYAAVERRIEPRRRWGGSRTQWEEILENLTAEIAETQAVDSEFARRVKKALLFYDLEDQPYGHDLLRARPGWQRGLGADDQAGLPRILLWSEATASPFSLVRQEFERELTGPVPVFKVAVPTAPKPPDDGVLVLSVTDFPLARIASPARTRPTQEAARARVEALLEEAFKKNDQCELDVLNDRICCSSEVLDALEEAYQLAIVELHEGELLRLQAVHRYALALRFFGEWRPAVEAIEAEQRATRAELKGPEWGIRQRLRLELLVLKYLLGDYEDDDNIAEKVRPIRREFRELNDLSGYVQTSRVLGNMLRLQGQHGEAEQVFHRAIGLAEFLAESKDAGTSQQLLVADCHRELADLYIVRLDKARAAESLADARRSLNAANRAAPGARYLSAVLDHIDATLAQGDDIVLRAAPFIEQAQAALETLLAFENPIRIAQVYNWLGLALARQIPRDEQALARGAYYLEKSLRIRESHQQRFTCGNSHLYLGELYETTDELDQSIEHYLLSRGIFNSLGARQSAARANASLARAFARKSERPGDAASLASARHLQEAETRFGEVDQRNEALELRYELQHGGRRPFGEVDDDTPLIAVGEYLLHQWIRQRVDAAHVSIAENVQLIVGVGDDAAVVSNGKGRVGWSFVFTTDAAPGSLADLSVPQPEYVGKFAVIQTLADILAMGARPVALLANVFLNRSVTVGYVRRVISSLIDEGAKYGVAVIGGDVKEREEQSIGCVGIGLVENKNVLRRDAARPGHAVGITLAAAPDGGKRMIGARWAQELLEQYGLITQETAEKYPSLQSILKGNIKSELLYVPDSVMKSAVRTGALRAAIDTSDGVLACLEILGRESGVGFSLDEAAIEAVIDERATLLARALDLPPVAFLFSAGHDWEIVFTCEDRMFQNMREAVGRDLHGNGDVVKIGMVVAPGDDDITLRRKNGQVISMPYYTDEKFVPRQYQDRPSQWLRFASRLRDR